MHVPPRFRSLLAAALVFSSAILLGVAGCADDNGTNPQPPPPTGASSFAGSVSGSGLSGTITINVATASPGPQGVGFRATASVTATGTLRIAGVDTVALTGSYDDVSDSLSLTGSGWTLRGQFTANGIQGTVLGPGGQSGVFSAQRTGLAGDSTFVVLGTFTSATVGGPSGVFNFTVRDTVVSGSAWATGDTIAIMLNGRFDPLTPLSGNVFIRNPDDPGGPPLAQGFIEGDGAAAGTYDSGTDAGTWTGQRQNSNTLPGASASRDR
jgi:hypothetical protein